MGLRPPAASATPVCAGAQLDVAYLAWKSISEIAGNAPDIRNCWQDADAEEDGVRTKLVSGQQNVIYIYDG